MTFDLPAKGPPQRPWVSLVSALTWFIFGHAFEVSELLAFAQAQSLTEGELARMLTNEWESLADFACRGSMTVRARCRHGYAEVELGTDDFRNFRFVGWSRNPPMLVLDRFPFTFSGGFRHSQSRLSDGFVEPVVWREDLMSYKRASQRWNNARNAPDVDGARRYLAENLPLEERCVGHKPKYMKVLRGEFRLSGAAATRMWTDAAREHRIPLHGAPRKTRKENSE